MKNSSWIACTFYGIGITGLGYQQIWYGAFRPVILPPSWPAWMHLPLLAYITGAALVVAGAIIVVRKNSRNPAILTGLLLLILFIIFQVPYLFFINPYSPLHLGLWTDPLKELALSGGAFVIAGLPLKGKNDNLYSPAVKLIPLGKVFFSITMIAFGIDHFIYPEFVASLVPAWIPGATFWAYFAGVALIGSGLAIIFRIELKRVALLLALMLFLWLILLHIPRAIADPVSAQGNEITSVFECLAFCGISLAIAATRRKN